MRTADESNLIIVMSRLLIQLIITKLSELNIFDNLNAFAALQSYVLVKNSLPGDEKVLVYVMYIPTVSRKM